MPEEPKELKKMKVTRLFTTTNDPQAVRVVSDIEDSLERNQCVLRIEERTHEVLIIVKSQ